MLLAEVISLQEALEQLVVAVNLTNSTTMLDDGRTMTEALAHRDALRSRHSILVQAADASAGMGSSRAIGSFAANSVSCRLFRPRPSASRPTTSLAVCASST